MANVDKYRELFAHAEKGTPEQIAYHGIIKALESDNPRQELEQRIVKAHEAIERHDSETWNTREGYRDYYNKQIALYQQALSALHFIGRQCRVESYGFGKVIDARPNDPGLPGVWVLVQFDPGSRHESSWFLSTIGIEFYEPA